MSATVVYFMDTALDIATVLLSLWALSRWVPVSWKAWTARRAGTCGQPPATPSWNGRPAVNRHTAAPMAARSIQPSGPDHPMEAYGRVSHLAAAGMNPAQIVAQLGLSRIEVELALKFQRCRQEDLAG
jgi:hypothetical protein